MPADDRPFFAAFISYRHVEPDRSVARWLHGALETYRVPSPLVAAGVRERLGRVFRDDEELAASTDLSAAIDSALRRSDALVVVCSPRTPGSRWVNEEVQRFRALGRRDRIFTLLIEGTPTESFPAALDRQHAEPLAANLSPVEGIAPRETRRLALLKLMAGLLSQGPNEVRLDDLRRRDEERRRRQWARLAIGAALLAVVFAALTAVALLQWQRAERELRVSRAERLAAIAQLALAQATAREVADGDLRPDIERSALLALESLRLHPGLAADAVLRRALQAQDDRLAVVLAPGERVTGVSSEGELLRAAGDDADTVQVPEDTLLAHSADRRWWLRGSDEHTGGGVVQTAALSPAASGPALAWLPHEWFIQRAAFTQDGRWLVTVTGAASADAASPEATALVGHTLRVWQVDDQREHTRVSLAAEGGIHGVWMDPGSEWLATLSRVGERRLVRLWPVRPERLQALACERLSRNLSPSEWTSFVGDGAPRATCPGLPVISE